MNTKISVGFLAIGWCVFGSSCTSMQEMSRGNLVAVAAAPVELAMDTVDTATVVLDGHTPHWYQAHQDRKAAQERNIAREAMVDAQSVNVSGELLTLRRRIDALRLETDSLLARNGEYKRRISGQEITLAERNRELVELREQKTALASRIAATKSELEAMKVNASIEYYVQKRADEGTPDPVEFQLLRLRQMSDSVETVLP